MTELHVPTPQFTCSDVVTTEEEVFQALSSLDPSKAEGCDKIGPKLLKKCALALYQPLYHLFVSVHTRLMFLQSGVCILLLQFSRLGINPW